MHYAEEKMMKAPTKTELQHALQKAGIPFKSKTTKAELEKLLADSSTPKNKKPLGTKATLRQKFERRGYVTSKQIDQIATTLNVQPATVFTAISDLKNPKYAGSAGPLAIQKEPDGTYRLMK
ncbi:MAG: hypothetical protein IIA10_07790 [Proteobacteria bacterium]|nr:hypothetical protein [Pseudomonadota bacterium]